MYALLFVLANFGIAIAARSPMMTTTMSSSIRVDPLRVIRLLREGLGGRGTMPHRSQRQARCPDRLADLSCGPVTIYESTLIHNNSHFITLSANTHAVRDSVCDLRYREPEHSVSRSNAVLLIGLFLLQSTATAVADTNSVYSTLPLQQFITEAARSNRVPPLELKGYTAHVESELALILRDSLGRELVGQLEQLAARAEWDRGGRYELHVVGFRAQSAGAPYSALSWTRMYTVPTLYGSRLVLGVNDGVTVY